MGRLTLSWLLMSALFASACSKKDEAAQTEATPVEQASQVKLTRDRAISNLKTQRSEDSAWNLAVLADTDPQVIPALVELLKDKGNPGLGRRLASGQYSSVREGTIAALVWCEEPGMTALKDQGFPILREGLKDPAPAVREHTVLAIATLNDKAQPLAADVARLCTDDNDKVRGVAFDALQKIGIPDALAIVQLMTHKDPEVRRLAAEAVMTLETVPEAALEPLLKAFQSEEAAVRTSAMRAVSLLGPKAAKAVPLALAAIRKAAADPEATFDPEDSPHWVLLMRVGEPAIPALIELMKEKNTAIQTQTAITLGRIGPPAKDAEGALKAALMEMDARLVFTAAVALSRIGVGEAEAVAAITRGLDHEDDLVVSNAIDIVPYLGKAGNALIPRALAKASSEMPFQKKSALDLAVLLGPAGAAAAEALGQAAIDSDDDRLRQRYVVALGTMGPAAKAGLGSLFKVAKRADNRPELRRAAMIASVGIGENSSEVVEFLKSAAAGKDVDAQYGAAVAMGLVKPMPPEIVTSLQALLAKQKPLAIRQAAVRSLALASPPATGAKAEFEALSKASKDDLAFWSRVALASFEENPTSLQAVVREGLKDRQPRVRAAALECLPRLGPANKSDQAVLVKLLLDTSLEVRAAAAAELARHAAAAKEIVLPLARLLLDPSPEVKLAAIGTLASFGPDAALAVPRLQRVVRGGDETVMYAAQAAIARIQLPEERRRPKRSVEK